MIRITAGEFRGRALRTPASDATRPSSARLRQALFNSLQARIPDAAVLDLFAGSGALGFEALSRGARAACFVEHKPAVVKLIRQNAQTLGVEDRILVETSDVQRWLRSGAEGGPFDIVVADPPYALGAELEVLEALQAGPWLAPESVVVLEWGRLKGKLEELPEQVGLLVKIREKNYGDSTLTSYGYQS